MHSQSRWASINLQHVNNLDSTGVIFNSDTTKKTINPKNEQPDIKRAPIPLKSKIHRPTQHLFSEDLSTTHAKIKSNVKKSPTVALKKSVVKIKKDISSKITQVQISDNIEESQTASQMSSSSNLSNIDKALSVPPTSLINTTEVEKRVQKAFETVKKSPIFDDINDEGSFRKWAMAEREKRTKVLQQASFQNIKDTQKMGELFSQVKPVPRKFGRRKNKRSKKFVKQNPISGYLYGPFSRLSKKIKCETKFDVPFSMFERAHSEAKVKALYKKKLQEARLEYMKIPTIPSDSDTADELDNVKSLQFVRTPYFCIPTVVSTQVKRSDRLKNRYLKGQRLRRIQLLHKRLQSQDSTQEEKTSAENQDVVHDADTCDEISFMDSKIPSIASSKDDSSSVHANFIHDYASDYRQRYHEFLCKKYLEQLQQYNNKLEQKLKIDFDLFKSHEMITPTIGTALSSALDKKSFRDFNTETASNAMSITPDIKKDIQPKKAKREIKKNLRLSRFDNSIGPTYIDPFVMEKNHNPEKGMQIVKNYTSLIRGHSNVRKRLQVNIQNFDEEKCGYGKQKQHFHRLVTEWDKKYIEQVKYRPPVRKFCVKTGIINIREMARKKFLLYFMKEDLMNQNGKQLIENRLIGNTHQFVKLCEPEFKILQDQCFAKAKEKLEMVDPVCQKTLKLEAQRDKLRSNLDFLMEKLMCIERKWETIMKMQNYYYILMLPLWRLEFDWIHCNKAGQLDMLKKSITYCKKIHIRSKSITELSLHSVKQFYETSIANKLEHMRKIQPDSELLANSLSRIKKNLLGLNKHNEIMLNHSEILYQQQQLEKIVPHICIQYRMNMQVIKKKVSFIVDRKVFLIKEVENSSKNQLISVVKNVFIRKIAGILSLCKTLFPERLANDESVRKFTVVENFSFISNYTMDLLSELDKLPTYILTSAETDSRNYYKNKLRVAKTALNEQNLFNLLQKQLRNHFTRQPPKPKALKKKPKSARPKSSTISPKP